jgi:Tol biopolymer transport system component
MGEVYRARDTRLGRDVALKVLPVEVAEDRERLRRFEQEAKAASSLSHPNILTVHDLGNEGGVAFLVTELLAGETLRDLIRRGPLREKQAVAIATELARGLAAAHAAKIVHRDLKPENVFLTRSGATKILDFGLARIEPPFSSIDGASGDPTLLETVEGSVLGTPGYMAPEQVRGERVDARADLFALGCVLWEMLTGKAPFRRSSAIESLSAILNEPVPDLPAGSQIRPAVWRIVERLLEKDPALRFQSATDLAFALEAGAQPRAEGVAGQRGANRWRRPVAALALFALGLAAGLWWPRSPGGARGEQIRFQVPPPIDGSFAANAEGHDFALSPDGRTLAYVADVHGQRSIYLRDLTRVEPRALPGTEGARSLFWSPDGSALAFFASGKLKRLARDGGPVQVICDAQGFNTASWGTGDTIVFTQSFGPDDGLFRVAAGGGPPTRIPSAGDGPRWVDFLPDGRRFLYWDRDREAITGSVYIGDLGSGGSTPLLNVSSKAIYAAPGWLVYTRSGTLVAQHFDADIGSLSGDPIPLASDVPYFFNGWSAFSIAGEHALAFQVNSAPSPLVWVDRHGRELSRVGPPAVYVAVRLSPDNQSAAVTISDRASAFTDVWIVDLEHGGSARLSDEPFLEYAPVWSPEGDRVAYTATSKGPRFTVTVRRAVDGSRLTTLPPHETFLWARAWTPAGMYLDSREPKTGWDLQRVSPLDVEPMPVLQTDFDEIYGAPSADGRWLAFLDFAADVGQLELLDLAAPGRPRRVAPAGGYVPRWRADGRELYFVSPEGWLSAVTVSDDDPPVLGDPVALFTVDLVNEDAFDVSRDGQRFLLAATPPASSQAITIALDWQRDLAAGTRGR